jgi:hypothetical protein
MQNEAGPCESLPPPRGAPAKTTVLVGFDSAWTRTNSGALVGVVRLDDGTFHELGPPRIVDYPQAESLILKWQGEHVPTATIILLDQPTIVRNTAGQRPVDNIVSSAEEDILGLGLATCLWAGIRCISRARTRGDRSVDRRRCPQDFAAQERSGQPGCLSMLACGAALGRAEGLHHGR